MCTFILDFIKWALKDVLIFYTDFLITIEVLVLLLYII